MIGNPNIKWSYDKIKVEFERLLDGGFTFEVKKVSTSRSSQQNRALHMFFTIISQQLNEMGLEYTYSGLTKKQISIMYTPHLVKEFVWRPIQIALFGIKSTTKLDTDQINKIIDVLTKFFGDRGVEIEFPSINTLMNQ
jgi:hypothetical protein